ISVKKYCEKYKPVGKILECKSSCSEICPISRKINKSVKGNIKLVCEFKIDKLAQDKSLSNDTYLDSNKKVQKILKNIHKFKNHIFFKGKIKINNDSRNRDLHKGATHCLI